MAITGFWPVYGNLKATLDYADNPDKTTPKEYLDKDLYSALRYAENDNKTDKQVFVGGINCSAQNAYTEMISSEIKQFYQSEEGKQYYENWIKEQVKD